MKLKNVYAITCLALSVSAANAIDLEIDNASDWGGSASGYPASNAIDKSSAWSTRWAANNGTYENLKLDLGEDHTVSEMSVSWGRGDSRTYDFEIRTLAEDGDSSSWDLVYSSGSSTLQDNATDYETYTFDPIKARYVRIKVSTNSAGSGWTDINEVKIGGATGLEIQADKVFDDGSSDSSYPASFAVNDDTAWASRWSATDDTAVNLTLEMDDSTSVSEVGVAWGLGDQRVYEFEIYGRNATSGSWTKVYDTDEHGESTGETLGYEVYDIDDINARQIRLKVFLDDKSYDYVNVTEMKLFGDGEGSSSSTSDSSNSDSSGSDSSNSDSSGSDSSVSTVDYGLDPNAAPAQNFDLWDWYLSVPTDEDNNGYSDSIKEQQLNEQWNDDNEDLTFDGVTGLEYYESSWFYTDDNTGAMVFECTVGGYKTSENTDYTRTELREMLRRGGSGDTDGSANNWAFSTIDTDSYDDFGGIDGTMSATLAVNKVTTTANYQSNNELYKQVGRIIIGQIHAEKNEPIRLYYHKFPNHENGSIYFAHEPSVAGKAAGEVEKWYGLLGNLIDNGDNSYIETDDMANLSSPSDGIALDEIFSYTIDVDGDLLSVFIYDEAGNELAYDQVNMASSLYDDDENYMFFKAGIYLNDKESDEDDTAKVSFYKLTNSHAGYDY